MYLLVSLIKKVFLYLFILLFVYAAVSKIIDFENFKIQLAQSPILSLYAITIAYGVVFGEIIIAFLLCFSKSRNLGLYLFLGFMTAFTIYIYLILNHSPFVPCSCGGILEKLGWTQHLWFNSVISLCGILMLLAEKKTNRPFTQLKNKCLFILLTLTVASLGVIALFRHSEYLIKKENPFIRRYIPHYLNQPKYLDLAVNSYNIAGLTADTLYLTNQSVPFLITAIPTNLKTQIQHQIKLEQTDYFFKNLILAVFDDTFYLSDGSIPVIYQGNIKNWSAKKIIDIEPYFSMIQPFAKNSFLFRTQLKATRTNVLGRLLITDTISYELFDTVLEKQLDGIFDTDGQLVKDSQTKQVLYTYYYRNEYLVYDNLNNSFTRAHTIDTTRIAKIQVTQLSNGDRKMSAPPYKVNSKMYAYDQKLYIRSELLGKNEPKDMWKQASIIDVYNYNKKDYQHSFYAYDYKKNKIKDFAINDDYFFALVENYLVRYELSK